ncbi:MAG: hypothetical protein IJX93_01390 [Clostridia bacterium]|nr:hypothetical protein [Clostridia bacterium]MBQ8370010.1 hypothetical protein [Clostridia bacterium]
MKKWTLLLLGMMLCACDSGLSAEELPYFEYTETETVYDYVWLDDELPADFDPESDYLYLSFSVGEDTRVRRINPYTLRTTELCADPLCGHNDLLTCPYGGMSSRFVITGEVLYSTGRQYAKVMGYNGTGYVEMDGSALGVNRYDLKTGTLTELVHHESMTRLNMLDIDFAAADGYLYYYAEAPAYDDAGTEIREDDGDLVTETHLYRMKLNGKNVPEDLGLYLGYTNLIIADGQIWNYYGFFNESAYWKDVPQEAWVLTDLENENPVVIPEVKVPLTDDADGYHLAECADMYGTGSHFLLYTGEAAETHVYRSDEEILYYADGWIWTAETLQEEWEEGGVIRSRQTGLVMNKTNIFTGERESVALPECPPDAGFMNAAAVVDGRYVILAVHGVVNRNISNTSGVGYYLRYDTETGESLPIYP